MTEEPAVAEGAGSDAPESLPFFTTPRFREIALKNFLSYKETKLAVDDFVALVGPNASGKSNAVTAFRLLRDIPTYGLPVALARHGGFDQLRHRSHGRPNNPSIRLTFSFDGAPESFYEISLASVSGKRYRVKRERARISYGVKGAAIRFESDGEEVVSSEQDLGREADIRAPVPPGQSALSQGTLAGYIVYNVLRSIQTVEINPALVGGFQEPSSTGILEPTGSNTASLYDALSSSKKQEVVERLAAIVPGIVRIEPRSFADQQTLLFVQRTQSGNREFLAKQMSDGTLRAFAIILALALSPRPSLLVIEEPEVAIHLGALQSLVEILRAESPDTQIVITTHSADIVDELDVDELRVVWAEDGVSRIADVSEHTRRVLRSGMMTPGALLRADALDPEASA